MAFGEWFEENKSDITIASGIALVATSIIAFIKASKKQIAITEEHEEVKEAITDPVNNELTPKEQKAAKRSLFLRTAGRTIVNYGPAILLEVAGFAVILKSHNDLKVELFETKEELASTAACLAATESLLNKCRGYVRNKYGEEEEQRMMTGGETVTVTETDEKGKEKKTKLEVSDGINNLHVWYFTKDNPYWDNDKQYMLHAFQRWQDQLNEELKAVKSHILPFSRVLDVFGIQPDEHQMLAVLRKRWKFDLEHPTGDNFVQVLVKETHIRKTSTLGEEYYEPAYILTFNFDPEED